MSLDFARVAYQLQDFARRLSTEEGRRENRLVRARSELAKAAQQGDDLNQRIELAKSSWLLSKPLTEPMDASYPAPRRPDDYIVVATDGSHIDVDRHLPVRCHLVNIGWACIGYGRDAYLTELNSEPHLSLTEEDMAFVDDGDASHEERVAGSLLSALRSVKEMERLADLIEALPPDAPMLALLDGTLVLWGLSFVTVSSQARCRILEEGVLSVLGRLRKLVSERPLVVASYISFPGGTEVTNALRISVCPTGREICPTHNIVHGNVNCGDCPGKIEGRNVRPCDEIDAGGDRQLFASVLGHGERSALFERQPGSHEYVYELYRNAGHALTFFYLRTPEDVPDEVARIEMPGWCAGDSERVQLAHSMLVDQCQRGMGYPVAIMEAHEQAVIDGADREFFRQMLDDLRASQRGDLLSSAKSRSKRGRWL